jgi:hypothetical protein
LQVVTEAAEVAVVVVATEAAVATKIAVRKMETLADSTGVAVPDFGRLILTVGGV